MRVVPIYNMMVLPGVTLYFKKEFLEAEHVSEVAENDTFVFLTLKEGERKETYTDEDFYTIGVSGKATDIEDDSVAFQITDRVRVLSLEQEGENIEAEVERVPEKRDVDEKEYRKRFGELKAALLEFISKYQWGMMARSYIVNWTDFSEVAVSLSNVLNLTNEQKYAILEKNKVSERIGLIEKTVYEMVSIDKVSGEAQLAVKKKNEDIYREDAIKHQIEFLQQQLDEMHPENITDVRKFEKLIAESGMNDTARKEAEKVLNRMKQEGSNGHEYGMLYDYLDFVTGLQWTKQPVSKIDLEEVKKVLDKEHYGLEKVKKRIIQQMAVMTLNKKQSGSILLFIGAPGTGKTSIGQGIAKALGREYVRISLGGVRDEAEIRGHRRTYVGAMPGRIMDGIRKSGVSNPVVVLDEIDKLSHDYNGDPASALLEVLDPEQNFSFTDHYMNVPYDLSDVLFICTANTTDTIPEPLLDRMELISFSGYTPIEKFHIAKKHLVPRAKKSAGLKNSQLKLSDPAIRRLIEEYTAEAGVRGLKKQLDILCRNVAVEILKSKKECINIGEKKLDKYLEGKPRHRERILAKTVPGVVTGLAWTSGGGEILFIEAQDMKGTGKLTITGQLGDVMKESVQIALSIVKRLYPKEAESLEKKDIHIHVPAGAVPKDGPSAGITLTTALASLLTGKKVSPEIAMTGEVSLRGTVMPIGGLPEKLLAAQRAGITKVLIPKENVQDLKEVAQEVLDKLEIIPVTTVSEVLQLVL